VACLLQSTNTSQHILNFFKDSDSEIEVFIEDEGEQKHPTMIDRLRVVFEVARQPSASHSEHRESNPEDHPMIKHLRSVSYRIWNSSNNAGSDQNRPQPNLTDTKVCFCSFPKFQL
jgi:hypothetical protein